MWWRLAAGVGLVLLTAALIVRYAAPRWQATARTLPRSGVSAAVQSNAVEPGLAAPSAPKVAGFSAADSAAALPTDAARAELKLRMKADWCSFGAEEAARQSTEVMAKAQATTGTVGLDALEDINNTAGAEVMKEAGQALRRRWAAQLSQRGDLRSMAVADILLSDLEDADPLARGRLQARARTASDPMLTALALLRRCPSGTCVNVEASQWSRLEPANLNAWLKLLEAGDRSRQTQQGYVLERVASQVRYARSYQKEAIDLLLSLPQTERPGLQADAEIQLLHTVAGAWPMASFRPVTEACRAGLADLSLSSRCDALAQLMWQQEDLLHRSVAVAIARALVQGRPDLRAGWEPRARELEAVQEWNKGSTQRLLKRMLPNGDDVVSPCDLLQPARALFIEQTEVSDWNRAQAEIHAARADSAALSAAWRREERRGALDPMPVAPAAR